MVANRMHKLGPTISIANRDQYSAVTSLSVCSHGIGPPGATALADALIGNLSLQELNFDHNSICAEGAAALSHALITVWNLHTLEGAIMLQPCGIAILTYFNVRESRFTKHQKFNFHVKPFEPLPLLLTPEPLVSMLPLSHL